MHTYLNTYAQVVPKRLYSLTTLHTATHCNTLQHTATHYTANNITYIYTHIHMCRWCTCQRISACTHACFQMVTRRVAQLQV